MPKIPSNESLGNLAANTAPVLSRQQNVGNVVAPPSAYELGGRQAQELGAAADALGGIANDMQVRKDRNDSVLANSIYREELLKTTTQLEQLKGRDARDVAAMYAEGEKKARKIALKGRSRNVSDRLVGVFENARLQGEQNFTRYARTELDNETRASTAMRTKELINEAVMADDGDFQGYVDTIREMYLGDPENNIPRPPEFRESEAQAMVDSAIAQLHKRKMEYLLVDPINRDNIKRGISLADSESFRKTLPPDVYAGFARQLGAYTLDIKTDDMIKEMDGMRFTHGINWIEEAAGDNELLKETLKDKWFGVKNEEDTMERIRGGELYSEVMDIIGDFPSVQAPPEKRGNASVSVAGVDLSFINKEPTNYAFDPDYDPGAEHRQAKRKYEAWRMQLKGPDAKAWAAQRHTFERLMNKGAAEVAKIQGGVMDSYIYMQASNAQEFYTEETRKDIMDAKENRLLDPRQAASLLNSISSNDPKQGSGSGSNSSGGNDELYGIKAGAGDWMRAFTDKNEGAGRKLDQGQITELQRQMNVMSDAFQDNTPADDRLTALQARFQELTTKDENGKFVFESLTDTSKYWRGVDRIMEFALPGDATNPGGLAIDHPIYTGVMNQLRQLNKDGELGKGFTESKLMHMTIELIRDSDDVPEELKQTILANIKSIPQLSIMEQLILDNKDNGLREWFESQAHQQALKIYSPFNLGGKVAHGPSRSPVPIQVAATEEDLKNIEKHKPGYVEAADIYAQDVNKDINNKLESLYEFITSGTEGSQGFNLEPGTSLSPAGVQVGGSFSSDENASKTISEWLKLIKDILSNKASDVLLYKD